MVQCGFSQTNVLLSAYYKAVTYRTISSLPTRSVCPEFICSKCWLAGDNLINACWSRVSLSVRWVGLSGRVHAVMYKVPDPCMC